jgi:hypothetical protein
VAECETEGAQVVQRKEEDATKSGSLWREIFSNRYFSGSQVCLGEDLLPSKPWRQGT